MCRHHTFIFDFNGHFFGEQDATSCCLNGYLVSTAGHKIVECRFEAREGMNAFIGFYACGVPSFVLFTSKSKKREKN